MKLKDVPFSLLTPRKRLQPAPPLSPRTPRQPADLKKIREGTAGSGEPATQIRVSGPSLIWIYLRLSLATFIYLFSIGIA